MFKFVNWEELSEDLFLSDVILLTLKERIWVFLTLSQLDHNVKYMMESWRTKNLTHFKFTTLKHGNVKTRHGRF